MGRDEPDIRSFFKPKSMAFMERLAIEEIREGDRVSS
jgi:hypothetical protein